MMQRFQAILSVSFLSARRLACVRIAWQRLFNFLLTTGAFLMLLTGQIARLDAILMIGIAVIAFSAM